MVEVKENIQQTPEQIKKAKEAADFNDIKNASANKVAENFKKTEIPENKNGIKDTELVSKKFPDLDSDVMKVILSQYKVLARKPSDGYRLGEPIGFDKLAVKQLYDLPVTTKANIAYLSSMITYDSKSTAPAIYQKIAESNYMKNNKLDATAISKKIASINSWIALTKEDFNFTKTFRQELNKIKQTEILEKFTNMFPAWTDVPLMPDIEQFAVGKWEKTMWLWWVNNGSRWLFDYNNNGEQPTSNTKNLEFGFDKTKPMSISVVPSWAKSTIPSTINLLIKDKTGNTLWSIIWSFSRNPSGNWNVFKWSKSNLPDVSIVNNTINIPNTYQDTGISLTAKSAQDDEANFSLSLENGRTIDPTKGKPEIGWSTSHREESTQSMKLGKFDLAAETSEDLNTMIDRNLFYANKTLKTHIPLEVTVGANQTRFNPQWIEKTIRNYKTFADKETADLTNLYVDKPDFLEQLPKARKLVDLVVLSPTFIDFITLTSL